jgi:hypothetical protein
MRTAQILEIAHKGRTGSVLRLGRALCVETHEVWLEDNRYLNGCCSLSKNRTTAHGSLSLYDFSHGSLHFVDNLTATTSRC